MRKGLKAGWTGSAISLCAAFLVVACGALIVTLAGRAAALDKSVIGSMEKISLLTPQGVIETDAKIDTGADISAIDEEFVRSIGLKLSRKRVTVESAQGKERRKTVRLAFTLADRVITTRAAVADRKGLASKVLIGKKDLRGFIVDPKREFLSKPAKLTSSPFDKFDNIVSRMPGGGEGIIIVPILSSFVVVIRTFAGIKTYGIFAPVVIALSLMEMEFIEGILIYLYLFFVSIGVKALLLNRFKLLRIAEMSLLIFTLVISLAVLTALPFNFEVTAQEVFFPLIITTHLIERFTKTAEEYRMADAFPLLAETFLVALLLSITGNILLELSNAAVWTVFFTSIAVVVAAGRYTGLRLSEVHRFKFLRKRG